MNNGKESTPTHLDLFSGIGGFSLAAERCGFRTIGFSEIDAYASAVLKKHWPKVPNFRDIRNVTRESIGHVDLITGGFPCQPFSVAGQRRGDSDERHLWPELCRVIGEVRPRFCFLENVPGLLSIDAGRVFGDILSSLAEIGYDAQWNCVSASAVGAPHQRDRLWILAYPNLNTDRREVSCGNCKAQEVPRKHRKKDGSTGNFSGTSQNTSNVADSDGKRLRRRRSGDLADQKKSGESVDSSLGFSCENVANTNSERCQSCGDGRIQSLGTSVGCSTRYEWPPEPNIRGMADGLSKKLHGDIYACKIKSSKGDRENSLEAIMRDLRWIITAWLTSQGRKSEKQLFRKLTDTLCVLSHKMTLGKWQEAVADSQSFMHCLRQACDAIGIMLNTSVTTLEAWESAFEEDQNWIILAACGGIFCEEWPNESRTTMTCNTNRIHRLRCLGNSIVPQVAEIFLKELGRILQN